MMHSLVLASLLLLYTISSHTSLGFVAYDCSSSNLNITDFSTLDVSPCHISNTTAPTPIPYGKLLQRKEYVPIPYKTCFVLVSYMVSRCSWLNDLQAVQDGIFDRLDLLGKERCAHLHQTRTYELPGGLTIAGLITNNTGYYDRLITGGLTPDGKCQGGSFGIGSKSWNNVIVQVKVKIILTDGTMTGAIKENLVMFPTGARFAYNQGYGIDQTLGDVSWSTQILEVCETGEFDVLYSGPMSKITYSGKAIGESSYEIYIVKSQETLFALRIDKLTSACGFPALQTEHPRLFILTDSYAVMRFVSQGTSAENMDMTAYINNKLMYLDVSGRANMESMYRDLLQQQCELERKVLLTKLGLAHTDLHEFAYQMGGGPGYTALLGGEIVYLIRCEPVNVEIRKTGFCFQELQVSYNNKSLYMAPKTHILQHYGSEVACNALLPVAYKLAEEWFALNPGLSIIRRPQQLSPSTTWSWSYESTDSLMKAGIYSSDMMRDFQRHLLFPHEVQAASKTLTRDSMGYSTYDQGLRFQHLVDESTISSMVEKKLQKMWGWFTMFGSITSGFLGMLMVWKLILIIFNTGLNASLLYKTFGLGVEMLAALFTGLTHFILHRHHQDQQGLNKLPSYHIVPTTESTSLPTPYNPPDLHQRPAEGSKENNFSNAPSIYPSPQVLETLYNVKK